MIFDEFRLVAEKIILKHYPCAQGAWLFGSHMSEYELPESDVDIAVLLPHGEAKRAGNLFWSPCQQELSLVINKDVDLINIRQVSTIFQKEIIMTGRDLFKKDECAVYEFYILCMALWQKLSEERAPIVEEIIRSGRVFA